jgi:SAM-dependent methyltransferase
VTLNDPATVAEEYASERGLLGRREAYHYAEGPDSPALAIAAVLETKPGRVLEVGCGPGEAAARIHASGAEVEAVDLSVRMVELTRAGGVDARVADVQDLPFEDASFDCALAAWMLYHVPDVDRALSELARVLRPGGRLIAVTNRREHLLELARLVDDWPESSFDDVNGPPLLRRHFTQVEERDVGGWINFPDQESVRGYVVASQQLFHSGVSHEVELPLRVRRAPVIYVATK